MLVFIGPLFAFQMVVALLLVRLPVFLLAILRAISANLTARTPSGSASASSSCSTDDTLWAGVAARCRDWPETRRTPCDSSRPGLGNLWSNSAPDGTECTRAAEHTPRGTGHTRPLLWNRQWSSLAPAARQVWGSLPFSQCHPLHLRLRATT